MRKGGLMNPLDVFVGAIVLVSALMLGSPDQFVPFNQALAQQ